ncbi:hypothetical protein, partial [Salmonella sp. s37812]|uniref:hypothetical protein n=1 Tax=Salmonella sp. s37812 TaxID=3159642 RepID=UPI00397F6D5B
KEPTLTDFASEGPCTFSSSMSFMASATVVDPFSDAIAVDMAQRDSTSGRKAPTKTSLSLSHTHDTVYPTVVAQQS